MKYLLIYGTILTIVSACSRHDSDKNSQKELKLFDFTHIHQALNTNPDGNEIRSRILPPAGYAWVIGETGTFGHFLQNLKLKPNGSPILDYTGSPIGNQSEHAAVLDIDIGDKDLQQCADAVIRMRAEYLWNANRKDEIAFHFTSGDLYRWSDHRTGIRPIVSGNQVRFSKNAPADDSYANFRKYLDLVFTYAGTISVNKETRKLSHDEPLQTGDILINPGSPGHVVFIVGKAENDSGDDIFLLAESYMPAQSIHVVTNPYDTNISPWYALDDRNSHVMTARFEFEEANFRRFN